MKLFSRRFRIGDRIIVNRKNSDTYHFYGVTGTIVAYTKVDDIYAVEFDKFVAGTSLGGMCQSGYVQLVHRRNMKRLRKDPQSISEKELMKIINPK